MQRRSATAITHVDIGSCLYESADDGSCLVVRVLGVSSGMDSLAAVQKSQGHVGLEFLDY